MHDHTLNFKADFDILGTANTAQLTSFVPVDQSYIWSEKPRQTMKLQREFVESEDDSRLVWNRATQYRIVNTDYPNNLGEYRGYRILPTDGTTHFTNNQSSNLANCIHPFTFDLAITKQKDTEPLSTHPNDEYDIWDPMINFDTFFDGESLVQEDLVVWFNLGMHHLPRECRRNPFAITAKLTPLFRYRRPPQYSLYDCSCRHHYDAAELLPRRY